MKILIPITGFGRGGGYRVLSELANNWINQGHKVTVMCPDSSDEPYYPTNAIIKKIDSEGKVSTATDKRDTKKSRWLHIKSIFLGLNLTGHQFDIILANHSLTAWPVAFASCGNAKKIYYIQAYEPEYYAGAKNFRGYLFAIGSALTYHLPLKRIVNAPVYFNYLNLRASAFAPPGIDLENFKPALSNRSVSHPRSIIVGCIGRNEPEKGTIYVLRAFDKLYRQDQRFLLRLAAFGDLPEGWEHERCEIVVPKNDNELADGFRFDERIRYNYLLNIPLSKKGIVPKSFSAVLNDEVMINLTKNNVYNTFDQNRFFIGLAYNFDTHSNLQ
ncbi:MAG: DUF2490 domain-containing protein, partial [Glaciimonas sp.]|nr:DUF2490 domain-containing protein [Glaciimonas sp.]